MSEKRAPRYALSIHHGESRTIFNVMDCADESDPDAIGTVTTYPAAADIVARLNKGADYERGMQTIYRLYENHEWTADHHQLVERILVHLGFVFVDSMEPMVQHLEDGDEIMREAGFA